MSAPVKGCDAGLPEDGNPLPPRKALLVEDDEAIARLVQAVAEDAGVELVHATNLAQGHQALLQDGFDVILADLMLPDGCGVDWLEAQWAGGRLTDTRVLAFSAGVSLAARGRLGAVGVQGFLQKPVSVTTLAQWLSPGRGLSGAAKPAQLHAAQASADLSGASTAEAASAGTPHAVEGTEAAIAELFGGDRELYGSFRAACLARLEADQQQGLSWLQEGNLAALERLGHSLKSALRLLGEPALAGQAQALERLCAQDARATADVRAAWQQLCQRLSTWAGPGRAA